MQNYNNQSGFFPNSIGAPQGDENGYIMPASNNTSTYFYILGYS